MPSIPPAMPLQRILSVGKASGCRQAANEPRCYTTIRKRISLLLLLSESRVMAHPTLGILRGTSPKAFFLQYIPQPVFSLSRKGNLSGQIFKVNLLFFNRLVIENQLIKRIIGLDNSAYFIRSDYVLCTPPRTYRIFDPGRVE